MDKAQRNIPTTNRLTDTRRTNVSAKGVRNMVNSISVVGARNIVPPRHVPRSSAVRTLHKRSGLSHYESKDMFQFLITLLHVFYQIKTSKLPISLINVSMLLDLLSQD